MVGRLAAPSTCYIAAVSQSEPAIPVLDTKRLSLTLPDPDAAPRVVRYLSDNREHHARWSPAPPDGFLTEAYWGARLKQARAEFAAGRSMRLFVFARDEIGGPVLGTCNFTQFVRGPFQACYLGFALDHAAVGGGLMKEATARGIEYAFGQLALHRIMANHVPENDRSAKLLNSLGFVVEGRAKNYLHINGAWHDHVLTSLTNPQCCQPNG